eukprot:TRINITY_DN535_c0_g1_i2.p1 TRINITY_DN535_c0_g1~~TRINITY_DN535_c0_g1_i2.p1  ORF type:complete len:514 (-),score=109.86 TRINITY_DN535_c0_g1_i2:286-1827(-)
MSIFMNLQGSISEASSSLLSKLTGPGNSNVKLLLVLTLLCVIVPLDVTQLLFAILGALCYYFVQKLQPGKQQQPMTRKLKSASVALPVSRKSADTKDAREAKKSQAKRLPWKKSSSPGELQVQTPAQPVQAPSFTSVGLEAEAKELMQQLVPKPECQRGVDKLAEAVKYMLAGTLPEVEVLGFVSSDLSRGRANGVAVPDVDVVINVSPSSLATQLSQPAKGRADQRTLQKWALRVCADKLVSFGGFKFRRSGFRGSEPKMTLLVPPTLGIFQHAVAIDISVNGVTPLHSAALLTECGKINPCAKELILLVRRWAKDRGVCHSPKGHFSPYIWSLLTIFYLQVAHRPGESLLPALEKFQAISSLLNCKKRPMPADPKNGPKPCTEEAMPEDSLASLLRGFMNFYAYEFVWKSEAVCVRRGQRGPAPLTLPIHIIEHDGNTQGTEPGPSVEDPFAVSNNLADGMNAWSFQRMREELRRAADILAEETASLSKLLEPWAPHVPETPEAASPEGRD